MRSQRKEASVVTAAIMLLACLVGTPVVAVDDLSLNVAGGSGLVEPGDTVTVTLDVSALSLAINGVQALIAYDDTILTLVGVTPTDLGLPLPTEGWVEVVFTDNGGDVTFALAINGSSTILDATVATFTFTVFAEGVSTVSFRPDSPPFLTKLTVASDNSTILPNKIASGSITSICSDGLYCNGLETFDGVSCQVGVPPDCSGFTDQCNDGVCNETAETCEAVPINEGLSCDDGDLCTTGDTCIAGACSTTPVDCSGLDDACNIGTCNPIDGLCEPVPANESGPCDDGVFCTGTETCNSGVCISSGDPCTPLFCDEVNDLCLAPLNVTNLELFYNGRFGVCLGGDDDGLSCSSDAACRNAICDVSSPQAHPGLDFLATGSLATVANITNYVRGITGIRISFNQVITFATVPEAAFAVDWSTFQCAGGSSAGLTCTGDGDCPGGSCQLVFSQVADTLNTVTVTPVDQGGNTVVSIVIDDYHVLKRWLRVTVIAAQITASGVELDGELVGNPVVLPSGENTPGGDAVFFVGGMPGDVNGDRRTTLTDVGAIRNCACFNPFFRVPITEPFDVDKDVWVRLGDPGAARAEVNPFFRLPLISP